MRNLLNFLSCLVVMASVAFVRCALSRSVSPPRSTYTEASTPAPSPYPLERAREMSQAEVDKLVEKSNVIGPDGLIRDPAKLKVALESIETLRLVVKTDGPVPHALHFEEYRAVEKVLNAEEAAARWALQHPQRKPADKAQEDKLVKAILTAFDQYEAAASRAGTP